MTPHKRFSKMIFLNAKNSESALLAEPHGAVMFSCRTLTFSAKVSCRTLEIAEPKALSLEKDHLAEPWNGGSFHLCPKKSLLESLRGINFVATSHKCFFWCHAWGSDSAGQVVPRVKFFGTWQPWAPWSWEKERNKENLEERKRDEPSIVVFNERKTKGQHLKGKIVSALFHTFWHFPHFPHFSRIFPPGFFLELRGFTTVLVQREEKRIKENEKKKTKPFCTLVVARLSPLIQNDCRQSFILRAIDSIYGYRIVLPEELMW